MGCYKWRVIGVLGLLAWDLFHITVTHVPISLGSIIHVWWENTNTDNLLTMKCRIFMSVLHTSLDGSRRGKVGQSHDPWHKSMSYFWYWLGKRERTGSYPILKVMVTCDPKASPIKCLLELPENEFKLLFMLSKSKYSFPEVFLWNFIPNWEIITSSTCYYNVVKYSQPVWTVFWPRHASSCLEVTYDVPVVNFWVWSHSPR